MKTFVACLLLVSTACKSDKPHAAVPPEPVTAKSVEPPITEKPAPASLPAAKPAARHADLAGVHVGSSGDDVDALMQRDDQWIAQRDCDSCADGDYVYGDVDDPQVTITVKKNSVVSIVEHSVAATTDVANEPIGPLALDMNQKAVEKLLGKPGKQTPTAFNGEYNRYQAEWAYPDQGITLGLASMTKKGMLRVSSISVTAPSTLKTKRGIGIGSTRAEANKAYADAMADEPLGPDMWVAGSTVGGGLELAFVDDKVSEIAIVVNKGE